MPARAQQLDTGPTEVVFGLYLFGVDHIDLVDNSFDASLWMWWTFRDSGFDPTTELQLVRPGRIEFSEVFRERRRGGNRWVFARLDVHASAALDASRYPFDSQKLVLEFETQTGARQIRFVPDLAEITIKQRGVFSPGWRVTGLVADTEIHTYPTTFGLDQADADQYSRILVSIDVAREAGPLVASQFVGFLVAAILVLMTYLVRIEQVSIRTGLLTAAVFASVINQFAVNRDIGAPGRSLIADVGAVIAFLMALVGFLAAIYMDRLNAQHRHHAVSVTNRTAAGASWALLIAAVVYCTSIAVF